MIFDIVNSKLGMELAIGEEVRWDLVEIEVVEPCLSATNLGIDFKFLSKVELYVFISAKNMSRRIIP